VPSYQYSAVNQSGGVIRGRIDAGNRGDLERRLARLGLSIINATEIKRGRGAIGGFTLTKVTRDDLSQFCFYVERLVSGGVPLLEGLSDIRDSVQNATLKNTIGLLIEDIEQGQTLSVAMRKHPKVFDEVFVSLVAAGEHSGELDTVLRSLSESIRWQGDIIKKTKKAVRYPIVAMLVVCGAAYGLLVLVVPPMTRILESLGQELPTHTVWLINTSNFLENYIFHIVVAIILFIVAFYIVLKTIPGVDYFMHKMQVRVPILGPVIEKILLSRFSNVFGLLYSSGVNVIDGLKISRGALGNKFVMRGLDGVIENITSGTSLSNAFRESGLFPPLVLRMIRLGEATGGVDSAMMQIKGYYDRDANEAIERAQAAIGPVVMLFGAGLLVWVILAVYGPLYDLVGNIG
jgi:type IV pilus assembly protein PilC